MFNLLISMFRGFKGLSMVNMLLIVDVLYNAGSYSVICNIMPFLF